ncbi:UDP-N-acetylmuramoyl-tripeptide--D-alanyl-D-alanine ligase [Yoonia sp. I 8.24]|uniref:Mur ligase family protein n=1 Tax=Yoonia sp. I 8.24 TaxID=1537229 RepID=UPI001EDDBC69|nr:UDP-N-acetylmuramoyl-tripeptide--D-alanyl-D-alanine ligase [Yoonia sp. I 8.24]
MKLIFLGALGYLLKVRLGTLLAYFQQEEYDGARYVGALQTVRLYDVRASVVILVAFGLMLLNAPSVVLLIAAGALGVIAWSENQYRFKKPLAMTERARRIYLLAGGFLILPLLISFYWIIFAVVAIQLAPFALIAANQVLTPFQQRINDKYIVEAREKLARMDPQRIGITGSFGKTTVKHILAEILEGSAPVFYSRGSINTVLGLTRHIRGRLQWSHKYFIAEMGAYGEGSIDRLCDFAQPKLGIVTAVGDAHTERFGSIDAIARAKSELVAYVCGNGGTAVINAEVLRHAPFAALKEKYGAQVITVAAENADVIVNAQPAAGGGWTIGLHWADGAHGGVSFELPLLGDHNVMNAALAVVLTLHVDPGLLGDLPYFTKTVSQIPHRLQKVESLGAPLVLDDAYNANELGFKSAVATLHDLAKERGGRAILVTPGVAELGMEHDAVHARLAQTCNEFCDTIYIVNPSRIRAFADGLDSGRVNVIEVASFYEARAKIDADITAQDVVLYENDLPDLLEEQRFL